MNAMRRPRAGGSALAVAVMIVPAVTGAFLLAGCTSIGGTVTTPIAISPGGSTPSPGGSAPSPGGSAPSPGGSAPSPGGSAPSPSGSAPASSTPASSAPAGSAAAVEEAALASLKAGPTVHVDIRNVESGTVTTYSDEATATGGKQVITVGGDQRATILYINGVGYVQGNEAALVGFFGVSQSEAAQLAGQWLSLQPGDTLGTSSYDSIVAGITLSSVATEIQLTGPDNETGPERVSGQSVLAISSPVPASQQLPASARTILYVAASGSRPVLEKLSGAGADVNQISFSNWGETVSLTPPANAVPVSSLGGPVIA